LDEGLKILDPIEELLAVRYKVDLVLKDALKEELKPHILSEVVYA